MEKLKSLNLKSFLEILKCCLIGIVSTLIGIVIFAFVLKFANLSTAFVHYINDIIKTFSIFIMVMCIRRKSGEKLLLKAIFAGVLYAILTFIIFSILNGSFLFNFSFVIDLLFSIVVSIIVSIIINLLNHKNV